MPPPPPQRLLDEEERRRCDPNGHHDGRRGSPESVVVRGRPGGGQYGHVPEVEGVRNSSEKGQRTISEGRARASPCAAARMRKPHAKKKRVRTGLRGDMSDTH